MRERIRPRRASPCPASLPTWLQSPLHHARLDEHCDVQSCSVDDSSVELQTRLVLVGGTLYAAGAFAGAYIEGKGR